MQENKNIQIPAYRQLIVPDAQDQETLYNFLGEPHVEVYYDRDDDEDFVIQNPDGSMSRIARCVNINGVQFLIPAEEKTRIPKSVYEHLMQCQDEARRIRVEPNKFVKIGEIPKRR